MKITDIKLTPISYPMPFNLRWGRGNRDDVGAVITEVFTDEGITGLGILNGPYPSLRTALDTILLPRLKGQNPLDIERLWESMYATSSGEGGTFGVIGGIDIALWDIAGKVAGLPIYRMLGALRDSVPVYIAPSMKQPEVIAQECEEYKAAGYPAIKLRLGLGFVGLAEQGTIDKDIAIVESGRKILGDKVAIGVDTDKTYDHFTALRLAPVLEENRVAWFEEPLDVRDAERDREQYVAAMARLQGKVKVPLSGGQGFFSRYQYGEIVSRHAVDIVQPDVVRAGGISELRRVADLASVWGLKCMPHVNCGGGQDIQVVATAHCLAALSNSMYLCYPAYDTPLRTELLAEQPKVIDGYLPLPQKPGLGIELNPDAVAKYTVKA
ncbi:MAG: mandelate racemase/muconate lactonizing enzyme family protein [Chloroflexi bacterium]|nr:mandelate racemase/muconate lactonizing enzyme family protein [Chloroflexota bacterium]MCL5025340.1 mandelate racemase/muconate lactonizing enzyme family protein [Chloroflexota bacterium]